MTSHSSYKLTRNRDHSISSWFKTIDGKTRELKPDDQAGTQVIKTRDVVPVIVTELAERENVRNEIENCKPAWAEGDELVPEETEEIWASVDDRVDRSFTFGKGGQAGTRETFDEMLEEIKGVLPNIARVLGEDRKSL